MKQGKVKKIVLEKVAEVADLCAEVGKAFDEEAVHKFRVSVKSLRSFLRLQKMHTGNSRIKLIKKFKQLYRIAGNIREAQLELKFIQKHEPGLAHYTERLLQTLEVYKKTWTEKYKPKITDKLYNKLSAHKYKDIHPTQLAHFFENRIAAIDDIGTSSMPTDSEIHDARKKIKDVLYTSKLAEKKWKAAAMEVKALPAKQLDELADMIGNYNDERIILEHVSAQPLTGMKKEEKSSLKHFKGTAAKKLYKKKADISSAAQMLIKPGKT